MSKLRVLAQKSAATAATAATKGCNTVATLFSQSGNTVATLHDTLHSLFSRLKTLFNRLVCGSSGNTSPNFAQEHENEGFSSYPADEYDRNDFDEWERRQEDMYNEIGWPDDDCEEWWDGPVYNKRGKCWEEEAVDEAIDDEQPGDYPPNMGDLPW